MTVYKVGNRVFDDVEQTDIRIVRLLMREQIPQRGVPEVVFYIPRAGASYAHLIAQEYGIQLWRFNPWVLAKLLEKYPDLKYRITDDCVGSGDTLAFVRKDLSVFKIAISYEVIWSDREYLMAGRVDFRYLMEAPSNIYRVGWWEDPETIKDQILAGLLNPTGPRGRPYSTLPNQASVDEIAEWIDLLRSKRQ